MIKKKVHSGEFPGGLVARIQCFHCRGPCSIPSQGTEIPQAAPHGQKKKYVQKTNKKQLLEIKNIIAKTKISM